ncbi:MAG: GNAT family N-acetyltransferase [Bdellovibrionales bacterium]
MPLTDDCIVRKIKRTDLPAIAIMMQRLAEQHHEISKAQVEDFAHLALGKDKISHLWIAQAGTEPAGFIEVNYVVNYPEMQINAHINFLYVRDEYRHLGVALKLVQKAIEDSTKKGCNRLLVEAYSTNEKATKFYEDIGFTTRPPSPFLLSRYQADKQTIDKIVHLQRTTN